MYESAIARHKRWCQVSTGGPCTCGRHAQDEIDARKDRSQQYEHALRMVEGLCRRHTRSPDTSPFDPIKTIEKIEKIVWRGLGSITTDTTKSEK